MTIRFGEYKKRDISFLLNFVANLFLYYTGYRWWTVNANFFRNKQHSFLKSRRFLWKKRIVTWLFEGKQDIIGNKSIHQVYAFIKSKRKKRKNRKKKSEKKEKQSECGGMTGQKEKRGATMRIQEVIKKTGLSRRTVYYYIDQKMISPVVDEHNGYHDFSEADIQKLFIIRKLREAGLSLADIRAILHKPRTTPFYLHKQLNALQSQMLTIQQTISEMDRLSGQLPVCQSLDQLAGMLADTDFCPEDPTRNQMESRDARLLAQYLWMAYLDTPVTEYQQFLWQKITQHTIEHAGTDLKMMSRYLQYISPEQIDATNINQYLRNQKIISLTEEDYPGFVEELKVSLLAFAADPVQQEKWRLFYQPVIHPTALFCVSVSGWMREFHPAYRRYYENTHTCCRQRRSENFWKKIQMKNDLVLGFCFYHSKRGCPGNKCHRQYNFFRFRRRVFQCGKENPAGFPSDAFKVLMNRGNFKTSAETRVIKTTEAEIFRNPKANGTAGEKDEFGNLVIFCEKCSNSILPQDKELLLKRCDFC